MIIPSKIAKESESSNQTAFFAYCAVAENHGFDVADLWAKTGEIDSAASQPLNGLLKWLHHVPNGGSRGDTAQSRKIRGARLKAEGVKDGVPDIHLPVPILHEGTWWHGLYLEMKKPSQKPKRCSSKGGMSDAQIEFREHCWKWGYGFATCYSWEEAVHVLKKYLESILNEN
jgi:hypothetical protein